MSALTESTDETATPDARSGDPARAWARVFVAALVGWFLWYLFGQGTDGYFARTVDRVDAFWVKLVFLNLPLQMALALGAIGAVRLRGRRAGRIALALAATGVALMLVHVALSIATA